MNDIPAKRDELHQKEVYSPPSRRLSEQNAGGLHRRAFLAASAGATVLLGGPSSAQVQSPVASAPTGSGTMPSNVRVERVDGSILLIGIRQETDRVDLSSVIGLGRLMYMLDHDDALRVAVLYSQGSDFVGGVLDPDSWAPVLRTGKFPEMSEFINPVGTIPPRRQKPLVVAVQGKCQGAGHELFLAADVRVAASDTVFAQPEVTRGHFPAGGAPITFVREAGWANAMRYMLIGDEWSADEAYRMGLVQYVTPPGKQLDRAIAVARRISAAAPLGIRATIASAHRALSEGQEAAYAALFPELARLAQSDDHQEYFRALGEKRAPAFRGR
ncbi:MULTISPECIES: crotonase/enoyl-CoA hydratase family protein [unclassified Bradyrhizobium]|uniref:crotonase/enoyl-CoA hydratase family protein n=1 Tax=unclassified Bradyrhizobium TaxID=2631580 RepID=UPI00025D23FF|nr:crotonase/enoyl-CoA hydratase family protein [Bradyrhizobium sp. WSM1253]EIG59255.1 enoyl-CoA hydratase/carnithine racemase [Bradyrhizobium sp. WSM1253]